MTKIISLNVRVWTRDLKRSSEHYWVERYRRIHNYIKSENPDIICLQEVWWPAKYVLRLGRLGYKKTGWGFSHPIYVRKSAKVSRRAVSIFSTMAIVDDVQYFSVHCRWEEDLFQRAMAWVWKRWMALPHSRCIAAGDFNRSCTLSIQQALMLSSAREELGIVARDTFANYKRPTKSHGELDHFFIGFWVTPKAYEIGPADLSDHRPIMLDFDTREQ